MNFCEALLEHTKNYESSTSFWKWSSYAAISSVIRDNCFWQVGDDKLFPNIYVLLLASSGAHRKGKPIRLAESLVTRIANTKIVSGRTSVQAIYEEMLGGETHPLTGKIIKGGALIFFAEELSAGIVTDDQSVGILTDIYDYRLNFKINLVSKGRRKIENMVFSMLAGSNEDLLKGVYTSAAINGGLLARTFLVVPNEFRKSNALMDVGDTTESYNKMLTKLTEISTLKGNYVFIGDAKTEYISWYEPFRDKQKGRADRTGVYGRIHTSVIKLAMILAANDLSLVIKKEHIEQAIEECLKLLPNYNTFTMLQGKSTIKDAGTFLIADLMAVPGKTLTRKIILRNHWMDFDADILDKLSGTLAEAGLLKIGVNMEHETTYTLTTKAIEMMEG